MAPEIRRFDRIRIMLFVIIIALSAVVNTVHSDQGHGIKDWNDGQRTAGIDQIVSSSTRSGIPDSIVEYLIITPEQFASAYEPLAEWKTKKGVPANIVTVEEIKSDPQFWNTTSSKHNDTAAQIHDFLADFNEKNGYNLTWVLLGADNEYIPARWIYTEGSQTLTYGVDSYPTDHYYSGLFSDWDSNGNGIFGEMDKSINLFEADYNPKAFVGRLPADSADQVSAYVDFLLEYEREPIDDGWVGTALLADAVFDPPNIYDNSSTPAVDEGYGFWDDNGLEANMKIQNYLDDNFTIEHLYDYSQIYGGNYNIANDTLDQTSFVAEMNNGYGLVNVISHSFLSGNGTVSYEGNGLAETWKRFFYYTDASAMVNGGKRPLVYFSDCDILNFTENDDSNFEHLLTNPNGGAVAVVGPTGATYRGELYPDYSLGNWWIADHFWSLFKNGHIRPGENLYRTIWDYYLYFVYGFMFKDYDYPSLRVNMVSYNLLGDPEVPIWGGDPMMLNVQTSKLYVTSDTIWVKVKNNDTGAPVGNALVCIHGGDGIYLRYRTDSTGTVSAPSAFTTPGHYNLTVTRDGYLPYVGELKVRGQPSDLTILSPDNITFEFGFDPPRVNTEGNITVKITNLQPAPSDGSFMVNFSDEYVYRGVKYQEHIGEQTVPGIAGEGAITVRQHWTIQVPGEHIVKIIADSGSEIEEINEWNNNMTRHCSVSGPDLRITASDITVSPVGPVGLGATVTINATIYNIDRVIASIFTVSFFDGNPDSEAVVLGNLTFTEGLKFNEKVTLSLVTEPMKTGGAHSFYVEVDRDNVVIESNELNNRAFTDYYINHPPSIAGLDTITVNEDTHTVDYMDLLDEDLVSDPDNNTNQLEFNIVSIDDLSCGFDLRDGRYVDINPAANWSGRSDVKLSLSDGINTVHTNLTVKILPVNDAPVINELSLSSTELEQDDILDLKLRFGDIDSNLFKVTINSRTNLFMGEEYSLDIKTGIPLQSGPMNWDGSGNFSFAIKASELDIGEHSLTVSVSDGIASTSKTIDLNVNPPGKVPDEDNGPNKILGMDAGTAYILIAIIILVLILTFTGMIMRSMREGRNGEEIPISASTDELAEDESESEEE